MVEGYGKRLALGTLLGAANLGLGVVVTLWSTPLFISGLQDQGWGIFGLLQSCWAALNLLAFGGTDATLYFAAREADGSQTRLLGLWHLAAALLGFLLLGFAAPALSLGSRMGLPAQDLLVFDRSLKAAGLAWAGQFFTQWVWTLAKARLMFVLEASHRALLTVAVPLAGLYALNHGMGVEAFFYAQGLAWFLGAVLLLIPMLQELPGGRIPLGQAFSQVAFYSRWAAVFTLAFVALQSADRFFVAPLGTAALGAYALASSLFQRGVSAFGLLPTLLTPAVSRMSSAGDAQARVARAFGLSLRLQAALAFACFLPLAVLGEGFLSAWTHKPDWAAQARLPLALLCGAGILASLSATCHAVLLGLGRARLVGLSALAGAIFGLGSAALAVPRLGLPGAALSALCGYAVVYFIRIGALQGRIFGNHLRGASLEHLGLGLAAWAAVAGLERVRPWLEGRGLAAQVAGLGLCALALAAAALAADFGVASWKKRESLAASLAGILKA